MSTNLVEHLIEKWLDFLQTEKRYSNNTVEAYQRDLAQFIRFMQEHMDNLQNIKDFENIKLSDFRSWLASRLNNNYTAKSNARALSVIKNFYRFLSINFDLKSSVVLNIRNPKIKKSLPKAFSDEEYQQLIDNIDIVENKDWIIARNYALFVLLYATGTRISEALSLNYQDLRNILNDPKSTTNMITVKGKGNKQRRIPLIPIVAIKIAEYIKLCPYDLTDKDSIFINSKGNIMHRVQAATSVRNLRNMLNLPEYITPHAFRHSFASVMLSQGADLRVIQELLGHADLNSTQIYTKIDQQKMLEKYQLFHPKGEN